MVVDDPSLRWKLGEDSKKLRGDIRRSPRVRALLARAADHVYAKWQGAHWVLSTLADLGYPPGDESLAPLRARVLDCWLDERYFRESEARGKKDAYRCDGGAVDMSRSYGETSLLSLRNERSLTFASDRSSRLGETVFSAAPKLRV